MDRFQELLWDLGEIIEIPLYRDKNHACRILLDEKLAIHMEMSEDGHKLLVASFLSEIPPGRFRENVLKESLKANASYHLFGIFAYIEKINTLILHAYLPLEPLNGKKLSEFLEGFIAEAASWHDAISNGQVAPIDYLKAHSTPPSPYDIPQK